MVQAEGMDKLFHRKQGTLVSLSSKWQPPGASLRPRSHSDQPVISATHSKSVRTILRASLKAPRAIATAPFHLKGGWLLKGGWFQAPSVYTMAFMYWSLCSDYDRFAAQLRELHGIEILNSTMKYLNDS